MLDPTQPPSARGQYCQGSEGNRGPTLPKSREIVEHSRVQTPLQMAPACWKEAALSALHSSLGFSSPSSLSAQGVDTSLSEAMANCHSGVRPVRHLSSEPSVESTERERAGRARSDYRAVQAQEAGQVCFICNFFCFLC